MERPFKLGCDCLSATQIGLDRISLTNEKNRMVKFSGGLSGNAECPQRHPGKVGKI